MRKLLYGAAAVVCLGTAGPAMANGSYKDVPVVEPVPVWSGCYLGLNVGASWAGDNNGKDFKKSKDKFDDKDKLWDKYNEHKGNGTEGDYWEVVDKKKFFFDKEDDDAHAFGGGHLGCNWDRGGAVFGVEGDIGTGHNYDYLASLRARLGAGWGESLVYVTGGVAFASFDRDLGLKHDDRFDFDKDRKKFSDFDVDKRFDGDNDETGFVVGLGWEYLLDRNFTFGVEGLYYWFDDNGKDHDFVDKIDHDPHKDKFSHFKFKEEDDNDIFVLRARLTYYLRREPEPLK